MIPVCSTGGETFIYMMENTSDEEQDEFRDIWALVY